MVAMREKKQHKPVGPGSDYISSEAVAHILECSVMWVHKLLDNGRLHAWKMKDDGTGWELVERTPGKRQQGKKATGGRVLFSKSEVEEYKKNHVPIAHKEPVEVPSAVEALIAHYGHVELDSVGYVTRAKLAETLYHLPVEDWEEFTGPRPGYRRLQDMIKTVADRRKWPFPPGIRKHQREG